ncbi:hypothetical protein [uncultured Bifidobacterium sp.]|uniref:hypothetical protein n=1 Tax=uncultured Bifidobacterium sp. TaxID=165187 RepID=UPI00258682A8|nr:hypothetical protein [uncultured Bifidobacterium sp.]
MNELILATGETPAVDLGALVKNFTDVAASQFGTAAPAVIAAAAGLAVIMWGVPKLIGFFKRTAK